MDPIAGSRVVTAFDEKELQVSMPDDWKDENTILRNAH